MLQHRLWLVLGPFTWLVAIPPGALLGQASILRAARLVDVRSGRLDTPGVLVIEGGRIRAVGGAPPAGARVTDLGDVTLLPGLMDVHTHITSDHEGDWTSRAVKESGVEAGIRGVVYARQTLLAGFTTVRDVGSQRFADVALSHAQARGLIDGPRIVPAGYAIGITGGHCDANGYAPGIAEGGPEVGVADGVDQVTRAVRYMIKHGAQVVKICATAGVMSLEASVGAQQYSEAEIRAAVEEAARHGLRVAAHAHGTEGILAAARAGVASIEHGSLLTDQAIALLKERGVYLVPTTYVTRAVKLDALPPAMRAKAEWVIPRAQESLKRAIRAGVKIALGTDAAIFPHGENAKELAMYVEFGMTPIDALRTATINAADLIGVDDRGTLEAGNLADVIAVGGNPLQDIRSLEDVRFVMIGGKVVKGGSTGR